VAHAIDVVLRKGVITMSDKQASGERSTFKNALEAARNSGVLKMDTTIGQLLDQLRDQERKGDLEAAKIKNGGVLVTKCFAFVTGCQ
jgi:hypothetical protein